MLTGLRKPAGKLLLFLLTVAAQEILVRSWDWWWERRDLTIEAKKAPQTHNPVVDSEPADGPPTPPLRPPVVLTSNLKSEPPPPDPAWDIRPGKEFDIFVLSQEYRWELGTTKVKNPGGELADMNGDLDLLLKQCGRRYQDLIAVGTASCEGRGGEELDRASDRADELIRLIRNALTRIKDTDQRHLYRLNLGKFRTCDGSVPGKTDNQRRVILVAIKQRLPDMNRLALKQALWSELDDSVRLPLGFRMGNYLNFELRESR